MKISKKHWTKTDFGFENFDCGDFVINMLLLSFEHTFILFKH